MDKTQIYIDDLRDRLWNEIIIPSEVESIESMLTMSERKLLIALARDYYTGDGIIVDAGCFLGGSTLSLCAGLKQNTKIESLTKPMIHSYDYFRVEEWAVGKKFFSLYTNLDLNNVSVEYQKRKLGDSIRDLFDINLEPYKKLISVYEGDITQQPLTNEKIEILFLDILKDKKVCDYVTENFYRKMLPDKSFIVHQDYLFSEFSYHIHVTMELLDEYFTLVTNCKRNSVVYLYTKEIPQDFDLHNLYTRLTSTEKKHYMDKAISRWHGVQKEIMVKAKESMHAHGEI